MAGTFTCDMCGETFPQADDWTEEDRVAEMKTNFGDLPEEDRASVCDDCYKEIKPHHPSAEEVERMRRAAERGQAAFDNGEPVKIKFNPKQACVIKNIGPEMATGMMLPAGIDEAIKDAIGYQAFRVELAISDWLLMWGGTTDDLVIEHGPNDAMEVHHKDGRLVCRAPGIKLEVAE